MKPSTLTLRTLFALGAWLAMAPAHSADPLAAPAANPASAPAAAWASSAASAAQATAPVAPLVQRPGIELPPEPQAAKPVPVPQFEELRLPNGVRVVLAPRHHLPLVTIALQVATGSKADPADRAGLARLTGSLLSKGAVRQGKKIDVTQLARQAEALGGTLDTSISLQAITLSMTVATPQAGPAVALMGDVLRQPTFPAGEIDRVRAQELDALKVSLSNPSAVASMVARRAYWGDSPAGASPTPASLGRINRQHIVAFHNQRVRPDATTLIVAGDVTLAQAKALAESALGKWANPRGAAPAAPLPAPKPVAAKLILVDMPGTGQAAVMVTAPYLPSIGDSAAERVGTVANTVLGGGYSARLNQEVRIKRGLSYGSGSRVESNPAGGLLYATAQTNNATAAEVVGLLQGELARLATNPPAADELAARQATVVGGLARNLETTAGLASTVATQLTLGRPLSDLQTRSAQILAVTAAQVAQFSALHWAPAGQQTVVVGDLKAAGNSLRQLDPNALVINAGELDLESAALVKTKR